MIENFLYYGQWVILLLSIISLYMVSSVKHETRLNGYILTGISRFSGAAVFIFVDLFAFVIANLIQTFIAFKGYYNNKKIEEEYLNEKYLQDNEDARIKKILDDKKAEKEKQKQIDSAMMLIQQRFEVWLSIVGPTKKKGGMKKK